MTDKTEYETASIVMIERNCTVLIPMRTLVGLVSFALAGPSNDAATAVRDKAVEDAETAIMEHFKLAHADGAGERRD